MAVIRITGWKPGFQKISHTKLLQDQTGLELAAAKNVTDRVLNSQAVEVKVDDAKAEAFLARLHELGAVAEQKVSGDR